MNKKGFSLVELLTVISLLGILMGIAIQAVMGYLNKAQNQAYDSIYKATYDAAQTYIMENGIESTLANGSTGNVEITKLVEDGYMTHPTDPNTKTDCSGTVNYKMKKGSGKTADTIVYRISLTCPGNKDLKEKIFPVGETY